MDFLSNAMQNVLTIFYNMTGALGAPNYGVAIILLTIVIKLVMYPLTVKQVRSMKAMQEIQPKVKELQEKYKGSPERLQQEMGALYKQSGVNPLSGCLPLIVQMPILIAIFYAIRDYQYTLEPSFLWIKNLAQSTPSDPTFILPILAAATTYVQQKQTMADNGSAQNRMMMAFMPIFIGYISYTFPAGVALYWVVSNIIQIIQQWWMYRTPAPAAK